MFKAVKTFFLNVLAQTQTSFNNMSSARESWLSKPIYVQSYPLEEEMDDPLDKAIC